MSSIEMLGSFALLPVGFGIAGLATDLIGPANVFVIGGGITTILGVIALLHPATRALDRPERLADVREPVDDSLPAGHEPQPS